MRAALTIGILVAVMLFVALVRDVDRDIFLEPLVNARTASTPAVKLTWDVDEFRAHTEGRQGPYRSGDHLAYLTAARQLLEKRSVSTDFTALWLPGVSVVAAAVIAVTGGADYGLSMVVATGLLMGLAMGLVVLATGVRGRNAIILGAGLVSLWLWPAGGDFLFGMGSLLSEGVSHSLLLMSVAGVIGVLRTGRLGWAVLSGGALGATALVRVFFAWVYPATFVAVPAVALLGIAVVSVRARTLPDPRRGALRVALLLLAAGITAHLVVQPWRNYKKHVLKQPGLVAMDTKYVWKWAFASDDQLPWYLKSGNAACHADPVLCREVQERWQTISGDEVQALALRTFLHHPFAWMAYKVRLLNWFWMGRSWSSLFGDAKVLLLEGLVQALLGLLGLCAVVYACLWRGVREARWALALLVALGGIYVGVFSLFQYEWRYGLGLRMLCYYLPFLVWALRGHRRSEADDRIAGTTTA